MKEGMEIKEEQWQRGKQELNDRVQQLEEIENRLEHTERMKRNNNIIISGIKFEANTSEESSSRITCNWRSIQIKRARLTTTHT